MGLKRGLVALNKVDRVGAAHAAAVRTEIRALTAESFLADAPIVDLSCETGTGVDTLREHIGAEAGQDQAPVADAPFRLAIDRAFTIRGSGVVVTGTVASGRAAVGDRFLLASTGNAVRIRSLHVQDESANTASAGDRTALNLAGASVDAVKRGDWLLDPDVRDPQSAFVATLTVVDDFPRPVKHNVPIHVYHATSHAQGRLLLLDGAPVDAGGSATVDVLCDAPLQVKVGDRVVFRDHDLERTLGGGRVVDLAVSRTRRRSDTRRERLRGIDPDDAGQSLAHLATLAPVASDAFARGWNRTRDTVDDIARRQGLEAIAGHWLAPALGSGARQHIEDALAAHHRTHPDSEGMTLEDAVGRDPARRLVIDDLVESGALRVANGRYALASHRAALPRRREPPVRRGRETPRLHPAAEPG